MKRLIIAVAALLVASSSFAAHGTRYDTRPPGGDGSELKGRRIPNLTRPAPRGPVRTVDTMYCSQAVDYVEKYKRYYKQTVDGPISLWPITPVSQNQVCAIKETVSFHVVRTLDRNDCLVGYTCRNSN